MRRYGVFRTSLRIIIWGAVFAIVWWQWRAHQALTSNNLESEQFSELIKLRTDALHLQRIIQRHYDNHAALPYSLQTLECGPPDVCTFKVWDGEIFLRTDQDWIAFRPDISKGYLRFSCRQTFQSLLLPYDARLSCQKVDHSSLPFVWNP